MYRPMKPLILSILALGTSAGAADFHSIDDIARTAEQAFDLGNGGRIEAAVEPGLRLPQCDEGLKASVVGPSSAEVRCDTLGWRLYVPVRTQRMARVYVVKQPLAAGQVLGPESVGVEMRDVTRLPGGVINEGTDLTGRTARRALVAGSVLLVSDAVPPRIIKRGDPVVVISRSGAIEVRANGKALAAAGVDESLAVENVSSRRVVQGRVLASGEVLVR